MNFANRGMYLEYLINQTADYYFNNELCLIFKRNIPISIIKRENNGIVQAKLKQKSYSDYYGSYKGMMFDFEAKQTNQEEFNDALIKPHQINHLSILEQKFNVKTFIIIHFVYYDLFFAVKTSDYIKRISQSKKIEIDWFKNNSFELKVIFPGIIDIISYLDKIMEDSICQKK